ncbi:hypothetical protein AC249_AIPGENE19372 [Exaiptasia diaphana]|nr:hypothetical protein AC249_AIPGENE19372 [Exaiptasia diaphana]
MKLPVIDYFLFLMLYERASASLNGPNVCTKQLSIAETLVTKRHVDRGAGDNVHVTSRVFLSINLITVVNDFGF